MHALHVSGTNACRMMMLPGDKTLLTSVLMGSQMAHLLRAKLWQILMPGYRNTGVSIFGMKKESCAA